MLADPADWISAQKMEMRTGISSYPQATPSTTLTSLNAEAVEKKPETDQGVIIGSGRGNRTPDTRIMIPLL